MAEIFSDDLDLKIGDLLSRPICSFSISPSDESGVTTTTTAWGAKKETFSYDLKFAVEMI
jgi:hypothetical protein